jgi:UDP-N-acetylglucosamine diphosphorylase / glucose-1-phosphate thymidylyltransferase / UDP-N-acetylgalactosamine diphosphorylase / glucosamine-1-phosphate N-acetyltransferase / galactosamine-1-phosphate N-acetyltransferase
MTKLLLYDDERARRFEPFSSTRPAGELRAGVALIRERWERVAGGAAAGFISAAHLAHFEEEGAPAAWTTEVPAGALVVNTRCIPAIGARFHPDHSAWHCGGAMAAVRLGRPLAADALQGGTTALEEFAGQGNVAEIDGRWLDDVWALITTLGAQLTEDIEEFGPTLECTPPAPAIRIGDGSVFVEQGARLEPMTVLDSTAGPILVRKGAEVRAFSRLVGPCYVGAGATILGDRVSGCSIGDRALIRGEISDSVVLGLSNKAHDGFVGHSYLGRWVNLGAGTVTSNLKNTYGTVSLWTPGGVRDTGTMKLGSFFGDHVKTGIGLRLTTGSVVGAGSNVYGSAMPPKFVPPFSWGEGDQLSTYALEKFLDTAERAMSRRQVALGSRARQQLAEAHARRGRSA